MAQLDMPGIITRLVTDLKTRFASLVNGAVAVTQGGTGATTAAGARTNLDAAQSNGASNTLYDAEQAITDVVAKQGTVPTGKTLQGQISTLQDSVSFINDYKYNFKTLESVRQPFRVDVDHNGERKYTLYSSKTAGMILEEVVDGTPTMLWNLNPNFLAVNIKLGTCASIQKAWDAITVYDTTVIGNYFQSGNWMFMAFKYTGSQYGMMMAIPYNYGKIQLLRVIDGSKYVFELNGTAVN